MQVKEVMTTNVRTAKTSDLVRAVAAVICTNKISGLPVVDDDNKLVGIISEKDILGALLPSYHDYLEDSVLARDFASMEKAYSDVLTRSVGSLMVKVVFSVSPEDLVMKAAAQMALQRFRRVPVVDKDNRLVGVVSLGDIHKAIFKRELGIR
ncbi:MAG: CBS domain-containing protein [Magnetococcales bacterium]|nr:CBS domain-containing protein [Magnetococcales bacterium]